MQLRDWHYEPVPAEKPREIAVEVLRRHAAGTDRAETLLDRGYSVVGIDNLNAYYDPALKRVIERVLLLEEEHASYKQPALKGQVLDIVRSEAVRTEEAES